MFQALQYPVRNTRARGHLNKQLGLRHARERRAAARREGAVQRAGAGGARAVDEVPMLARRLKHLTI